MTTVNQEKLLLDRVDTLYSNAVLANLTVLFVAALFVYVFIDSTVNQLLLTSWTSSLAVIAVLRLFTCYSRWLNPGKYSLNFWANTYTLFTGMLGCVWAASIFIVLQTNAIFEIEFVYVILFCVIASSVTILSAMPLMFYIYIIPPALVLGTIPFIDDRVPIYLSIGVFFFTALSIRSGHNLNQRVMQIFKLEHANEGLEQEIVKRINAEEDLNFLAHHDALTKLPNRLLLDARLKHAMDSCNRSKNSKVAILFIDLDNFKNINDSLGHAVGDKFLCRISDRMIDASREVDTVARLGGDEFVIILEDIPKTEDICRYAQNLIDIIDKPVSVHKQHLHTSASIGISVYPDDGSTVDELIKNADAAMYKAKKAGRHNYQFYTKDLTEAALDRVVLENELVYALDHDQIEVHYQAQISLTTQTIVGVEALVRWNHPKLGLLSPYKFLPIAEEAGLMNRLGAQVLHKSCLQMRQWKDKGINIGTMAVNLAGSQIHSSNLVAEVEKICADTGCKTQWLELEITEGAVMQNAEKSILQLQQLRKIGIKLAVDDFGTGYSSLSYLKLLPIHKLKIDRSFIINVTTDNDDASIVRAIIALGKSLNLTILAEGIETIEQQDFLIKENCDIVQGYYHSKPVEASKVEELYRKYNEQEDAMDASKSIGDQNVRSIVEYKESLH